MGVLTVDAAMGSGPAARSYMWDVTVAGVGPVTTRCTTVAQPSPTYEKIEANIRGFTIPEAGAVTWNEIAFTCIENDAFEFIKALYALGNLIWDPASGTHTDEATGNGQVDGSKIILMDLTGGPVITWTLHGAVLTGELTFPSTTSEKTGTYEIGFTLSYAYATMG